MIRMFFASLLSAVFILQGSARAQDTIGARLAKQLYGNAIAASSVPPGYKFEFIDPIARGDFEDLSKVEGRVAARFSREVLTKSNPELKGSWEGFTYYAFGGSAAATAFTLPVSESAYVFQSWLHDDTARAQFDTKKQPSSFSVPIKSAQGVTTELRCLEWDFFIGCLLSQAASPVAIHLTLLEPTPRSATTAAQRRRIAEARIRTDGAALITVARQHLSNTAKTAAP